MYATEVAPDVGRPFSCDRGVVTVSLLSMNTEIIHLTALARPRRPSFGEYLVRHRVISRFQLFRALQLKDRRPAVPLGQCAVELGYVQRAAIERAYVRFTGCVKLDPDVELENARTDVFLKVDAAAVSRVR
jgi:hypothetical protein